MFKTILNMLAGALLVSAVGVAVAQQTFIPANNGRPPLPYGDEALIDQKWLYGLAGGANNTFLNGVTAAGTTQAGAKALPALSALISVDTVPGSSGVSLPQCMQGLTLQLYNNTATALTVYPSVTNNPVTAAQDTINNLTSLSLSGHTPELFFCPKSGIWAAK